MILVSIPEAHYLTAYLKSLKEICVMLMGIARQRWHSERNILELERLGISRSLIGDLSASEAKERLRALLFVLQRYMEARETNPAALSA